MNINQQYTYETVKDIVSFQNTIANRKYLAQKWGRTPIAINTLFITYNHYKNGTRTHSMASHPSSFKRLFAFFDQIAGKTTELAKETPQEHTDNLVRLEKLFTDFQTGLVAIIDKEAKLRTEKRTAEVTKEYEEKIQRLETLLEAAKNSNISSTLKKLWGR